MFIVTQYPTEVRAALAAGGAGKPPESQELELSKLTIDGAAIDAGTMHAIRRSRETREPIRCVVFKKKIYVIDGRHRVMKALRTGQETVHALVTDIDDDNAAKRKERPQPMHSALVTHKAES